MPIRLPHRRDKIALRYESWASALDAGVEPVAAIGASGANVLEAISSATSDPLTAVETQVFQAAESAGEIPRALRDRAAHERATSRLQVDIIKRLAYPCALLLACLVLSLLFRITGMAQGFVAQLPFVLGAILVAVVVVGRLLWRRLHDHAEPPAYLAGPLAMDYAAIPYLSSLRALYRAGVPILEAHTAASATAPVGYVRARLRRAGHDIERSDANLSEALATHEALDEESLGLLKVGEQIGDLEPTLDRLIERRSHTLRASLANRAKMLGIMTYALMASLVAAMAISFYSGYFSRVLGR